MIQQGTLVTWSVENSVRKIKYIAFFKDFQNLYCFDHVNSLFPTMINFIFPHFHTDTKRNKHSATPCSNWCIPAKKVAHSLNYGPENQIEWGSKLTLQAHNLPNRSRRINVQPQKCAVPNQSMMCMVSAQVSAQSSRHVLVAIFLLKTFLPVIRAPFL